MVLGKLKEETSQYQAGYIIVSLNVTTEADSMPQATSIQQAELNALSQACTLAKNKTANIYTDSQYVLGAAHDIVLLWKQKGFLTSFGQKIKKKYSTYVLNFKEPFNYLTFWPIKTPTPTLWQTREKHFADESARRASLNLAPKIIRASLALAESFIDRKGQLLTAYLVHNEAKNVLNKNANLNQKEIYG